MPAIKLKTSQVTVSQPPKAMTLTLRTSVRTALPITSKLITMPAKAKVASQEICVPNSPLNRRLRPVWPHLTTTSRHAATFMAMVRYDRSLFAASQASETVVAKGELKEGISLGATYIRSVAGWHDDRQQHPPAGGDDHGTNGSK